MTLLHPLERGRFARTVDDRLATVDGWWSGQWYRGDWWRVLAGWWRTHQGMSWKEDRPFELFVCITHIIQTVPCAECHEDGMSTERLYFHPTTHYLHSTATVSKHGRVPQKRGSNDWANDIIKIHVVTIAKGESVVLLLYHWWWWIDDLLWHQITNVMIFVIALKLVQCGHLLRSIGYQALAESNNTFLDVSHF